MQGQSPYLVNLGLFYSRNQWNASVQYNRIGKRLIGVGRNLGDTGDQMVNIPDSYEMPRNSIDLSASLSLCNHFEIKLGVRDLLAEKVAFKQFNNVINVDFMPNAVSPLLNAASFEGVNSTWFDKVNFIGAFSATDNWLSGWTNFDPENTNY